MYYIGFFSTDLKKMMLFRSGQSPTKKRYWYFGKVLGPYVTEADARDTMRTLRRTYGCSQNPVRGSRAKYCRERQMSPSLFDPKSFRTIPLGKSGKRGVIGCPKNHYHNGKCKVGTRLQTILHPEGSKLCPKGGKELRKRKRNPLPVTLSKARALALTKKVFAHARKVLRNPGEGYHNQKFFEYMGDLEKFKLGSPPYITALAKAYAHLDSATDSSRVGIR